MRVGWAIVTVVLAIVLQVLAAPWFRAGRLVPDFPFLALAFLGLFAAPRKLLLLAAAAAIAIDAISLDPMGTRLAGYLPALWLLGKARRTVWSESIVLRTALTLAAAVLAFEAGGLYSAWIDGRPWDPWFELEAALYTALVGVGFHATLDLHRPRLGWSRDRYYFS